MEYPRWIGIGVGLFVFLYFGIGAVLALADAQLLVGTTAVIITALAGASITIGQLFGFDPYSLAKRYMWDQAP